MVTIVRLLPHECLFTNCSQFLSACKTQVDLGFVIDGSGSIEMYGKGNFKKCLDFVKSLTRAFVISATDTRVGAIVYSSRSDLQFNFKQYTTQAQIETAINNIKYPGSRTKTGQALTMAKDQLFNDVRPNVPRVLVVLTDGRSNDDVVKPSEELRNTGIIIFAIGLGKNYNKKQLISMATEENVLTADFPDIMTIVTALQTKLCKGETRRTNILFSPIYFIGFYFILILFKDMKIDNW